MNLARGYPNLDLRCVFLDSRRGRGCICRSGGRWDDHLSCRPVLGSLGFGDILIGRGWLLAVLCLWLLLLLLQRIGRGDASSFVE